MVVWKVVWVRLLYKAVLVALPKGVCAGGTATLGCVVVETGGESGTVDVDLVEASNEGGMFWVVLEKPILASNGLDPGGLFHTLTGLLTADCGRSGAGLSGSFSLAVLFACPLGVVLSGGNCCCWCCF